MALYKLDKLALLPLLLKELGTSDAREFIPAVYRGKWDKAAIAWGYLQAAPGVDESKALAAVLDEAWKRDVRFLTNQDIETHPRADWWSNGVDAAAELVRMLEVRRAALRRFGGRPRLGGLVGGCTSAVVIVVPARDEQRGRHEHDGADE